MREEKIICITCPIGCAMTVRGEGDVVESIEGNQCKRGLQYAQNEFTHPVRILTTVVKLADGKSGPLVAVRSNAALPRERMFECMDVIRKLALPAPVRLGDVVIRDILGTGVDIVAAADAV